jgi:pantothenate synthetase
MYFIWANFKVLFTPVETELYPYNNRLNSVAVFEQRTQEKYNKQKSPGKFQGLVLGMGVEPTLALLQTGF